MARTFYRGCWVYLRHCLVFSRAAFIFPRSAVLSLRHRLWNGFVGDLTVVGGVDLSRLSEDARHTLALSGRDCGKLWLSTNQLLVAPQRSGRMDVGPQSQVGRDDARRDLAG